MVHNSGLIKNMGSRFLHRAKHFYFTSLGLSSNLRAVQGSLLLEAVAEHHFRIISHRPSKLEESVHAGVIKVSTEDFEGDHSSRPNIILHPVPKRTQSFIFLSLCCNFLSVVHKARCNDLSNRNSMSDL